jgi:hypothetical protein
MKPRSRSLLLSVSAIGGVLAVVALHHVLARSEASAPSAAGQGTLSSESIAERSGARAAGCTFIEGSELSYALTLSAEMILDAAAMKAAPSGATMPSLTRTSTSTLVLKTLSTDDASGAVLLARYRDVDNAQAAELGDLTSPFLVRIDRQCQLTGYAHLDTTALRDGRAQQSMTDNLVWSWPSKASGGTEVREGANDIGVFRASYKQIAGSPPKVERHVEAFTRIWSDEWEASPFAVDDKAPAGKKEHKPLASAMTVDTGAGPWFSSLEGSERLAVAGGTLLARIQARSAPTPDHAFDGAPTAASRYVWEDLLHKRVRARVAAKPKEQDQKELAAVKKLTLDQAMTRYELVVKSGVNISETWPVLQKYLTARPEASTELGKQIKDGKLPEDGSAGVFVALGKTPTTEARDALLSLKNDASVQVFDRSRAAFSLVDREDVGVSLASALHAESQNIATGASRSERLYARHAALALGMMGNLRGGDDPAIADHARAAAREILAKGTNAITMSPGFGVVANLGDPALLSLVTPYMRHQDPEVRRAATVSIRRMPPSATASLTAEWLRNETNADVKRDLYGVVHRQHIDARTVVDRAIVTQAMVDLARHPSVITRQAIVDILGEAIPQYPEAKAALLASVPAEAEAKDEGIFEQLARYLSGDEILAAMPKAVK